jgi:phosphoribosylamine--glycine ligase
LDDAAGLEGVTVFSAGVGQAPSDGGPVTAGGRVLDVVGQGPTLAEARDRAYAGVAKIDWRGMRVRHDIAAQAAEEEQR